MGGEKSQVLPAGISSEGSPPRGRGKAEERAQVSAAQGITPAWAGKSPDPLAALLKLRDHPRVGGEKAPSSCHSKSFLGSPPRGRGKVHVIHLPMVFRGITPAWAGKRQRYSSELQSVEDHPRMGGEKMFVR